MTRVNDIPSKTPPVGEARDRTRNLRLSRARNVCRVGKRGRAPWRGLARRQPSSQAAARRRRLLQRTPPWSTGSPYYNRQPAGLEADASPLPACVLDLGWRGGHEGRQSLDKLGADPQPNRYRPAAFYVSPTDTAAAVSRCFRQLFKRSR